MRVCRSLNGGRGKYTVGRFLEDTTSRWGGPDAVLLWPTYENMGLDDRSQVALYEALPGGFAHMTNITDQFHARGVKGKHRSRPFSTWVVAAL